MSAGPPVDPRPLVSVVIPCFNQAHFLGEAIASALAQTYPRVEIVVVDDGSTDDTHRVAARHSAVRCLRQTNQGLAAARNTGLRASRGAYLVFVDADDRLLPRAIEVGVGQLDAAPHCGWVSGHYRNISADGVPQRERVQLPIAPDPYVALLQGNHIGMHATVLYRRSVLERIGGFDTTLPVCEDYDLYLRLARCSPGVRHGELVAEYRRHSANMSGNVALMLRTALAVLRAQWPHVRTDPSLRAAYDVGRRAWRAHYGEALLDAAREQWRRGDRAAAVRTSATLLRRAPDYLAREARGHVRRAFERQYTVLAGGRMHRLWRRVRGLR